jgi:hypothetical protein
MKSAKAVLDDREKAQPDARPGIVELVKAMEQYDVLLKNLKAILKKAFLPATYEVLDNSYKKCMSKSNTAGNDPMWKESGFGAVFEKWAEKQDDFLKMLKKIQKTEIKKLKADLEKVAKS